MTEKRKKYLVCSVAENNDQSAFEELFVFYYPGLVSFAAGILNDRQLAEEVVEDVFLKLWENRNTLVSINNFSHYIYTASKYAAINALKARKKTIEEITGDEFLLSYTYNGPEADLISNENIKEILRAINQLPPRCRLIFRLVKEEGMKYQEVAQLLQLSVKTVENQMIIAMGKIRESLEFFLPELKKRFSTKKA
ncbi:RNA polymerase sigma-70 factor [Niabella sp. 3A5MI-3]|nr:RNA polymerase sigma-70 factor [Niabella beijingensis]